MTTAQEELENRLLAEKEATMLNHRTLRSALAVWFLIGFLFPISLAQAAAPLKKVVITFAAFNERSSFLFVAKDMRFFEEQGLDAQIVQVRSGPIAISALAAGDAQFYTASATGAVFGAMAGGLDLVFVGGIVNKLDGDFVASPKIESPSDLKGKILGVQSIGGGIWTFTMLALDHWGLVPERDIQFRVIGDQSVIAQALLSGTVDAAYLGYTFGNIVERQGFRILADLAKAGIPYQGIGILARRSYVDRSPDVVERTLKTLVKAVAYIQDPANKQAVMRVLAKWLRLSRVEDAEPGYEMVRILYDRRIFPTKEGIANALRILSRANAKFSHLKAEEVVDDRVVRKLEREGVLK